MKILIITIALLSAIRAETGKWGVEEQDDVAVLTTSSFDDFLKKHRYVLVKFYAPWCGHCKSMAPGYSKLAKRMKGEEKGIPIAKLDATVEKEIATKFGVRGYPTLKFFVEGNPIDYSGQREEEAIYSWLQKKTGPVTSELTTLEEVKELETKSIAVLFATTASNEAALKEFNNLAASIDDISFYYTFNEEVKRHYDLTDKANLVIFRNFDDGRKILSSPSLTTDVMKQFLSAHRYELVTNFDQAAAERIFGSQSTAIFLFTDDPTAKVIKVFKAAAQKNQGGELIFSQSTITTGLGAKLSEFVGVTSQDAGTVRLVKFENGAIKKFKLENVTEESIRQFLDDFKNNKLTPHYKSAQAPEANNEPVKVVVGTTFEQIVMDNTKTVLLEAYAPWCGHCKQLEPIYNELATKLAGVSDLVIAKIDATANEHDALNVKSFPTIKLYKKDGKSTPIDFTGQRTVEGFVEFLEKEMGKKLTGNDAVDTEL